MTIPIGHSNTVVVGLGGSASAQRAVRWAAAEAARRTATLRSAPGLDVEVRVEVGSLARLIEQESKTSALVVVGSRGVGGFTGLVLGSTSQALVRHAPCPVLLVRPGLAEQMDRAQTAG